VILHELTCHHYLSKWFYDIFIGVATGIVRCCSFVEKGFLVSWSLVIDEYGEHEDLHGSDHQNVISYDQERI
jgi:hypothetical protein